MAADTNDAPRTLGDLALEVRSKNAGPFWMTLEAFMADERTYRLADALIKANKDFDMLIVPNMYHGEGGNPYLVRRRWDYFVRYLLGVTPPEGFEVHEDREPTFGPPR